MQQTAVKPPAAAARVPLAIVSLYSWPGSRRCTCMSMKPGHTHVPAASITAAPWGTASLAPTRAIRSEEHTSELQSLAYLVCRLLLEKKKTSRHGTRPLATE